MQGATVSPAGCITAHRSLRCRRPNGGADRTEPRDHPAGAPFADHRSAITHIHAPASPRAAIPVSLPNPRIGHASGV